MASFLVYLPFCWVSELEKGEKARGKKEKKRIGEKFHATLQ